MPGRNPPWKTALTYFKHDVVRYQVANRPDWGHDELKYTIGTVWNGDTTLRAYYAGHIGAETLPGLPAHFPDLPQFAYQKADLEYAKASRALPPERDTDGNPITDIDEEEEGSAPSPPTDEAPVPAPMSPPSAVPAVPVANNAAGANNATPAALPPPTPAVPYPFDWWPAQPWHAEPASGDTVGISTNHHEESQQEYDRFQDSKPYMWPEEDETDWHGLRFLGAGTYGYAGLWCKVNETRNITSCMAIKESRAEEGQWRDPLWWRDLLPREIRIHQLIDQNRPTDGGRGHESLLKHRGYRLLMRQRRFRLYMNYYEGGNLREAVEDNFELREQNPIFDKFAGYSIDDVVHLDENGDPPLILPAGFIWWIFRRLVDACQVLHSGQALDVDGAKADWKPITHLDIRFDNIFLQPRAINQDGIRPFPNIILADYGMAICATSDEFPENPAEFLFKEHDARFAPEHRWMDNEVPVQMDDKTDVWQIASVIFELMANGAPGSRRGVTVVNRNLQGEFIMQPILWPALGQMNTAMDGNINAWPHEKFPTIYWYNGTGLPSLIRRCLNWNKDLRPTLVELRNRIDQEFQDHPEWEQEAITRPARPMLDEYIYVGAHLAMRNRH